MSSFNPRRPSQASPYRFGKGIGCEASASGRITMRRKTFRLNVQAVAFVCDGCGRSAIASSSTPAYRKKRYCSRRCWNIHAGAISACQSCNVEFKNRPGQRKKWCSWKCYSKQRSQVEPKPCFQCKRPFVSRNRHVTTKTKFCSRTCMWAYRKENAASLKVRFYDRKADRGPDWKEAAKESRSMVDGKCQTPDCTTILSKRAHVDHIVPYRLLLKLRESDSSLIPNDQRNLIPLCQPHHMRKTGIETRLFKGDVMGFISEASAIIPRDRVLTALQLYGLYGTMP